MTIVYNSKRLKWMAIWLFILLSIGALPSWREISESSQVDSLIRYQNEICLIVEGQLEQHIEGLYGVPQELELPNIVISNLRAKYASSPTRTDLGVQVLDEALISCITRKKYQSLIDKIYSAVYPNKFSSAD